MKRKIARAKGWFIEIVETEFELIVHRDGASVLRFIEHHDPTTWARIVLDPKDDERVRKAFRDRDVSAVGVRWNKYAHELGLEECKWVEGHVFGYSLKTYGCAPGIDAANLIRSLKRGAP